MFFYTRFITEEGKIQSHPIPGEQRHDNLFVLFIQPDSHLTLTYAPESSFTQAHLLIQRDTCIHMMRDTIVIPRIFLFVA